jgi:hypothetical protein
MPERPQSTASMTLSFNSLMSGPAPCLLVGADPNAPEAIGLEGELMAFLLLASRRTLTCLNLFRRLPTLERKAAACGRHSATWSGTEWRRTRLLITHTSASL